MISAELSLRVRSASDKLSPQLLVLNLRLLQDGNVAVGALPVIARNLAASVDSSAEILDEYDVARFGTTREGKSLSVTGPGVREDSA